VDSANAGFTRALLIAVLVAMVAIVNYRGVSGGTKLSNLFTVTKLGLLVLFISSGLGMHWIRPGLWVRPLAATPRGGRPRLGAVPGVRV